MAATDIAQTPAALDTGQINKRQGLWDKLYKARWAYLFVATFFILFILFSLYPIGFSLYLSLNSWKGLGPMTFIGLGNYSLLLKDTVFWQSMLNGVIFFALYVPVMTLLALI